MKAKDLQHQIADVQAYPDARKLAIDKVGIKAIRHPIQIMQRVGGVQHTVASFNMYVGLPHQFKGTHMSRFVEILSAHEREITVETFQVMLQEMVEKLEAEEGRIEMAFPYFVDKAAPGARWPRRSPRARSSRRSCSSGFPTASSITATRRDCSRNAVWMRRASTYLSRQN